MSIPRGRAAAVCLPGQPSQHSGLTSLILQPEPHVLTAEEGKTGKYSSFIRTGFPEPHIRPHLCLLDQAVLPGKGAGRGPSSQQFLPQRIIKSYKEGKRKMKKRDKE